MFKLQKYKKYFIQGNNFHISDQIQRNIQLSSRFENFSYLWLTPTLFAEIIFLKELKAFLCVRQTGYRLKFKSSRGFNFPLRSPSLPGSKGDTACDRSGAKLEGVKECQ